MEWIAGRPSRRASRGRGPKADQGVRNTRHRAADDDGRRNLNLPPTPTVFRGSLSTVTIRSARSCRAEPRTHPAPRPRPRGGPQPICKFLFLSLFRQARPRARPSSVQAQVTHATALSKSERRINPPAISFKSILTPAQARREPSDPARPTCRARGGPGAISSVRGRPPERPFP